MDKVTLSLTLKNKSILISREEGAGAGNALQEVGRRPGAAPALGLDPVPQNTGAGWRPSPCHLLAGTVLCPSHPTSPPPGPRGTHISPVPGDRGPGPPGHGDTLGGASVGAAWVGAREQPGGRTLGPRVQEGVPRQPPCPGSRGLPGDPLPVTPRCRWGRRGPVKGLGRWI